MRILLVSAVLAGVALLGSGCGEEVDELGPYVQKMEKLATIDAKIKNYQKMLEGDELAEEAKNVKEVFDELKALVDGTPIPEDKGLKALHNSLVRSVDEGLTKLKDPDSITFIVNARKRTALLHESIVKMIDNLEREWTEQGRTEPFPIKVEERL